MKKSDNVDDTGASGLSCQGEIVKAVAVEGRKLFEECKERFHGLDLEITVLILCDLSDDVGDEDAFGKVDQRVDFARISLVHEREIRQKHSPVVPFDLSSGLEHETREKRRARERESSRETNRYGMAGRPAALMLSRKFLKDIRGAIRSASSSSFCLRVVRFLFVFLAFSFLASKTNRDLGITQETPRKVKTGDAGHVEPCEDSHQRVVVVEFVEFLFSSSSR